jgi:hypothetical protein
MFWRGAVYAWNDDGSIPVRLGPFQEQFRQYLLGLKAFPQDCSLLVMVREEKDINRLTYEPIGNRKGKFHVYRFPMPGLQKEPGFFQKRQVIRDKTVGVVDFMGHSSHHLAKGRQLVRLNHLLKAVFERAVTCVAGFRQFIQGHGLIFRMNMRFPEIRVSGNRFRRISGNGPDGWMDKQDPKRIFGVADKGDDRQSFQK